MIPMFCVVLILFVYPFAGAGLWMVNTAGHGGGSIWHGLACWPTAGLFQVPDLHLRLMLLNRREKRKSN